LYVLAFSPDKNAQEKTNVTFSTKDTKGHEGKAKNIKPGIIHESSIDELLPLQFPDTSKIDQ
jgi:hypothetical protein